jgi:hypothetical protein
MSAHATAQRNAEIDSVREGRRVIEEMKIEEMNEEEMARVQARLRRPPRYQVEIRPTPETKDEKDGKEEKTQRPARRILPAWVSRSTSRAERMLESALREGASRVEATLRAGREGATSRDNSPQRPAPEEGPRTQPPTPEEPSSQFTVISVTGYGVSIDDAFEARVQDAVRDVLSRMPINEAKRYQVYQVTHPVVQQLDFDDEDDDEDTDTELTGCQCAECLQRAADTE